MGATKNIMLAERDEKTFGLLKIIRTSYPNDQHLFELRPATASDDPRGTLAINAKPHQLLAELRRITTWLESQIGMS